MNLNHPRAWLLNTKKNMEIVKDSIRKFSVGHILFPIQCHQMERGNRIQITDEIFVMSCYKLKPVRSQSFPIFAPAYRIEN